MRRSTPHRSAIAHHCDPFESIKTLVDGKNENLETRLCVNAITVANNTPNQAIIMSDVSRYSIFRFHQFQQCGVQKGGIKEWSLIRKIKRLSHTKETFESERLW